MFKLIKKVLEKRKRKTCCHRYAIGFYHNSDEFAFICLKCGKIEVLPDAIQVINNCEDDLNILIGRR